MDFQDYKTIFFKLNDAGITKTTDISDTMIYRKNADFPVHEFLLDLTEKAQAINPSALAVRLRRDAASDFPHHFMIYFRQNEQLYCAGCTVYEDAVKVFSSAVGEDLFHIAINASKQELPSEIRDTFDRFHDFILHEIEQLSEYRLLLATGSLAIKR